MKIYIDQSGRVEYTSHDTVIAFTNGKQKAVKVLAKTKRQIQEMFRRRGASHLFVYRTFSALIFLLVKNELKAIDQIVIDTEYPGQNHLIKDMLLEFIKKEKAKEPVISFQKIGKKSKAHFVAYNVFIKKIKVDKTIDVKELAILAIKNDRGLLD